MNMTNKYYNAKNIKAELDSYVMGQEKGTRAISIAISQHLRQSLENLSTSNNLVQTDNVLLIGPTGSGKTETFRVLRKLEKDFQCPVLMFNILDYSATKSWQGDAITKIFKEVLERAVDIYYEEEHGDEPSDVQKAEIEKIANRAIILLDEFDKIALSGDGKSRQFMKEYQSNLLKIIEGNTYDLGPYIVSKTDDDGKNEERDIGNIVLDSTHMMFVFMGAFTGIESITRFRLRLEQIIKQRKNLPKQGCYQETCIGFVTDAPAATSTPPKYTYEQLVPSQEDIIRYGIMRELVGRIPVRTVYKPLSEDVLVDIMLKCKTSAYRKYQLRFRQSGHELRCDRSALREIAHAAVERGTGARGLMTIFAEILQDTQFKLSGEERSIHCLLRGKEIRENKPPLLHDRTKAKLRHEEKHFQRRLIEDLQIIQPLKPEDVSPDNK